MVLNKIGRWSVHAGFPRWNVGTIKTINLLSLPTIELILSFFS